MANDLSRRKLLKSAAVATTSLAIPVAMSQTKANEVEKHLKAELSEEAKALLKSSLQNLEQSSNFRQSYKLPENSEPCFVFSATAWTGKKRK